MLEHKHWKIVLLAEKEIDPVLIPAQGNSTFKRAVCASKMSHAVITFLNCKCRDSAIAFIWIHSLDSTTCERSKEATDELSLQLADKLTIAFVVEWIISLVCLTVLVSEDTSDLVIS